MTRPTRAPALLLAAALVGPAAAAAGDEEYAPELPEASLEDPLGTQLSLRELARARGGLVLVVTAPTLANEDAQEGWDEHLRAARPAEDLGRLVFLQDMEPSWFEDTALERMREAYDPDDEPILLIDPEGDVRAALGVEEDETVVLVYDGAGRFVRAEEGEPSRSRARRLWRALAEANGRS